MKKYVWLVMFCLVCSLSYGKTIEWKSDDVNPSLSEKSITISEDVVISNTISISRLEREIAMYKQEIVNLEVAKSKLETLLEEVKTALNLEEVDGKIIVTEKE